MRRANGGRKPGTTGVAASAAPAVGRPAASSRSGVPRFLRSAHGAGAPLAEPVRQRFERDGVDLSGVRIHADTEADQLARQHGALAFTVAQDIYFKAGHFEPGNAHGEQLLAHELAHALQHAKASDATVEKMSNPGDAHEREADAQAHRWLQGETPRVTQAPAGVLHREPDPNAAQAAPVLAEQAAVLAPPQYTSYFDEVVPGVLEAMEAHGEIPFDHALWLITQSYGEQSPLSVSATGKVSYYLPSEHRNRLFNEHASVEEDPKTKVKTVVPGQEREGVRIYNLAQKEFKDGKYVNAPSPTFGYDSAARSTGHHIELLKERRPGVYEELKSGGSFEGFVDRLKSSGYATEPAYVKRLKGLKEQVRKQVSDWLRFRVPEMRRRIEQMVAYHAFLKDNLAGWKRRLASESDPVGEIARQCEASQGLVDGMAKQLASVRAELARLERFAGAIKVKLPAQGGEGDAP